MGIAVENLTKFYGARQVVSDLSFHLEPGKVLGFIGPNGAGKTTLSVFIKAMLYGLNDNRKGKEENERKKYRVFQKKSLPYYYNTICRSILIDI